MNELLNLIQQQLRLRLIDESIPRIVKCLELLNEDQIWWSPNPQINSIGNLMLHLNGNVRQWLIDGLGDIRYNRLRQEEFSAYKTKNKDELLQMLFQLSQDIETATNQLSIDKLKSVIKVQCFEVSGVGIIVHVIEHFSYHTGQISLLTKLMTEKDLGYYAHLMLD